jgi:hypothetical protein
MSPSHRAGEDSILAKLEREPARRHGKPGRGGARVAWYGAGFMVAAGLTATLVWLAADNGNPAPLLARAPTAPPVAAPARITPAPLVTTVAPPHPSSAALIVDPPSDPPPLRLLTPAPKAAEPVRVPVRTPVRVPATPAKPGVKAAPRTVAVPPKPKAPAAKPAARPAGKLARAPQPPRQSEQVDSDVALISAVIVYGSGNPEGRREETPEACADESCRSRPPRP